MPLSRVACVVGVCAGGLVACSLVTHAYEFQQGTAAADAAPPDTPCLCVGHPDFARPACEPGADAGAGGPSSTYSYAVDRVALGARRAEWSSDSYAVGLNQDCSDRDGGQPACKTTTASVIDGGFQVLPHGIDNAFATQVLAPMQDLPNATDVETQVNAWIAGGLGGFVIVVQTWDGQPDDPDVTVDIAPALPGDAGPSMASATRSARAYVAGARLVADFGHDAPVRLPLGSASGALLPLDVYQTLLTAKIQTDGMTAIVISGVLQSNGQLAGSQTFYPGLEQLVLGCSGYRAGDPLANRLVNAAYDLPDFPSQTACTRMSFGIAAPHATLLASAPMQGMDGRTSCPAIADAGGD